MVAERIQGLDEMLRQAEVLRNRNVFWPLKDVRHLKRDGLDEAFGMISELLIWSR